MARRHKDIVQGKLSVSGHNSVSIELPDGCPDDVVVKFIDDDTVSIPCNPAEYDEIAFDVNHFHGKYELMLKWNVQSVRKVMWMAYYL